MTELTIFRQTEMGLELKATVWSDRSARHDVLVVRQRCRGMEDSFSGTYRTLFSAQFDAGILQTGSNTVQLTLVAGDEPDVLQVESFDFVFPRKFVAKNDALHVSGDASLFKVKGLLTADFVVYSTFRNRVWRLDGVISGDG